MGAVATRKRTDNLPRCHFCWSSSGPHHAGFLKFTTTWRWTFHVLLWLEAVSEMIVIITLPETLASILLCRKARQLNKDPETGLGDDMAPGEATDRRLRSIFRVALTRPWITLFDLISFLVVILLSGVHFAVHVFQHLSHRFSAETRLQLLSWRFATS